MDKFNSIKDVKKEIGELYNIYYIGDVCGNPKTYEGTTNNFKQWLKLFNEGREKDNQFTKEDFELDLVSLSIYL